MHIVAHHHDLREAPDPVQAVREMAAAVAPGEDGDTVFEAACEAGRAYRDDMDARRWALGDLGALLQDRYPRWRDRYGQGIVDKFAISSSARRRTIYEYVEAARFYPPAVRAALAQAYPTLAYSHFRAAMRTSAAHERAHSLDECRARAIEFLILCDSEEWTVDQADRAARGQAGAGRLLFSDDLYAIAHGGRAAFVFDTDTVTPGCSYRVTIKEAE